MSARDYSADPLELLRRTEDCAPPAGAEERVRALFLASTSGAALGLSALGGPVAELAAGTFRQLARRFAAWSLLPLAAGVVIGASGHALLSSKRAAQASSVAPKAALVPSAWAPNFAAASVSNASSVAPLTASSVEAPSPAKSPAGGTLAEERAVLDRARQKLAAADPERALSFLEQHARKYPNGKLSEEREAMLINVLVSLGRTEQAKARGAAFRKRFPKSLMQASVKAALAANSSD